MAISLYFHTTLSTISIENKISIKQTAAKD